MEYSGGHVIQERVAMSFAVIQMVSQSDVMANLGSARRLLEQAAEGGARLAVLPENFVAMGRRDLAGHQQPAYRCADCRRTRHWRGAVSGRQAAGRPGCAFRQRSIQGRRALERAEDHVRQAI